MAESLKWLLLVYKVPREPTASRVYVWRKLKKLGAMALQDAVWLLPATAQTREQLQWLAAEIKELDGQATLWESSALVAGDDATIVRHFSETADRSFREILAALKRKNPDLSALSRRYQQTFAKNYFNSELGQKVRQALLAAAGENEK